MSNNWNLFDEIKLGLLNLQTEIEFSKPGLFINSLTATNRAAGDDDDDDQIIESDDNHSTVSKKKVACTSAVSEKKTSHGIMDKIPDSFSSLWNCEDDDFDGNTVYEYGKSSTSEKSSYTHDDVKKTPHRRCRVAKRPALKRSYSFDYDDDFDDIIDDSVEAFREYQKEVIIKFIEAARNISNSLSAGDEELEDDMVDAWKDLLKKALCSKKISNCKSYKLLRGCGVTDDMFSQLLGLSPNAESVPKSTSEAEIPAKRAPAKRGEKVYTVLTKQNPAINSPNFSHLMMRRKTIDSVLR